MLFNIQKKRKRQWGRKGGKEKGGKKESSVLECHSWEISVHSSSKKASSPLLNQHFPDLLGTEQFSGYVC